MSTAPASIVGCPNAKSIVAGGPTCVAAKTLTPRPTPSSAKPHATASISSESLPTRSENANNPAPPAIRSPSAAARPLPENATEAPRKPGYHTAVRLIDWYLGLGWREKTVVAVSVTAVVFLASFLVSIVVLRSMAGKEEEQPPSGAGGGAQRVTHPEATTGSSAASAASFPQPDVGLRITDTGWEREKAVVEGRWSGEVSSVHCDLFEGVGDAEQATDWWEREVPTAMDFSKRTFSQEFVETGRRDVKDPIDPGATYSVQCSGSFSGGWSM